MSATIIRLHSHRAVAPRVNTEATGVITSARLGIALADIAATVGIIGCCERHQGRPANAARLRRLSEGLEELAEKADRLQRKLKKARKKAKRGRHE